MLRRRKEDVETELPGRTTKTFFVPMTETQRSYYEDYEHLVARLAAIARRRPLTRDEFEKLQRYLACMRMVCDTPAILEDKAHDCPKMEELERLLPDLLADPERKIIVFSEWVRMLERRLAEAFDVPVNVIDAATHAAMLRLANAGFVAVPAEGMREVFPGPGAEAPQTDHRIVRASALVERAQRKFKAAALLEGGGFGEEARTPAVEAACLGVGALAALRGSTNPAPPKAPPRSSFSRRPTGRRTTYPSALSAFCPTPTAKATLRR